MRRANTRNSNAFANPSVHPFIIPHFCLLSSCQAGWPGRLASRIRSDRSTRGGADVALVLGTSMIRSVHDLLVISHPFWIYKQRIVISLKCSRSITFSKHLTYCFLSLKTSLYFLLTTHARMSKWQPRASCRSRSDV